MRKRVREDKPAAEIPAEGKTDDFQKPETRRFVKYDHVFL
jgi:hypothetical protein